MDTVLPAIDTLPVRALAVFDAIVNCTVPDPVRLPPPAKVIQLSDVETLHEQLEPVVTVTLAGPPVAPMGTDSGATVNVHWGGGAADWVTE